jgi:hypothetical protein
MKNKDFALLMIALMLVLFALIIAGNSSPESW